MFHLPVTTEEQIGCFIANRVASVDNDTYICRSYGRRKAGRPAKYYAMLGKSHTLTVTAFTDAEAVEKINDKIARQSLLEQQANRNA